MKPERWQQINDLFQSATECAPEQRAVFLEEACRGDESLRREVESLIACYERAEDFIESPAFEVAPELLTNDRTGAMVGELIGHYRIESLIGVGGMGEVYLARDERLARKVALKFLPERLTADKMQLSRFKSEARAASALNHPNILTVYEVGAEGNRHFIATEFIRGVTLRASLARGRMNVHDALEVTVQVASALSAAHEAGVVHRDIKPENIMLRPDGYVKVLDFGIAKLTEQQPASDDHGVATTTLLQTHPGLVLGTARYMSPEQTRGQSADARSDIWSLGVLIYEMVGGVPPFSGATSSDCIASVLKTEAPPLPSVAPGVPMELQTIVQKALRKNRDERYQTIAEMLTALRSLKGKLEQEASAPKIKVAWLWTAAVSASAIVSVATLFFIRYRSLPAGVRAPSSSAPATTALSTGAQIPEKSIAVLPFENLSEEKANAYFAEGVQDEILTRLAAVRDLKVISRTSTAKYQSKPDNLKTVAQELGVSTILEGAVQKAGDKVRVNVQLINARADTHLWAKSYDRDFKDVLGVESEVSQQIADALQANLSPSESHALASAGTRDAEAYDFFLRGEYELHQAESSLAADVYDRADAFYRQALAHDPNFPEAAAELARSRLSRHWQISRLAPAELEEARSIIDRALALASNSPEAHFVRGLFFYWGHRQYEMALTEFSRTLELQPNNALARHYGAAVYRRRGEWERSLADFQRAQELDPRDAWNPTEIGSTYLALRQWKDAERAAWRALAIDPHNTLAAVALLYSRLHGAGDAGSAQTFEKEEVNDERGHLKHLAGRVALRVLAGEPEAAKSMGEEARPLLEARLRERPDDTLATTWLSWVYLALGRNADALRLFRQAADSISIEKDALDGPLFQNGRAQIEARAGAPEQAINRLRRLLSIPAGIVASIALLKIDPVWDPIRNRPDFQQLLSGPEQIGPNK
jgi:eukaryotic-like serine/threonine-protein kinase